jgi:hypothetical protein
VKKYVSFDKKEGSRTFSKLGAISFNSVKLNPKNAERSTRMEVPKVNFLQSELFFTAPILYVCSLIVKNI